MFNGKQQPLALSGFLIEAQVLLTTAEECLNHLRLIHDDEDALNCMLATLLKLNVRAAALGVSPVASFCQTLRSLLKETRNAGPLSSSTVETLNDCFALLGWQLELIDVETGQLELDEAEQHELIETFKAQIRAEQNSPPT